MDWGLVATDFCIFWRHCGQQAGHVQRPVAADAAAKFERCKRLLTWSIIILIFLCVCYLALKLESKLSFKATTNSFMMFIPNNYILWKDTGNLTTMSRSYLMSKRLYTLRFFLFPYTIVISNALLVQFRIYTTRGTWKFYEIALA